MREVAPAAPGRYGEPQHHTGAATVRDVRPVAAILPWGILEDFIEPLGISLEEFCREFTGSYVFGYAAALRQAGVRVVLFYVSCRVTTPVRRVHGPTGATICVLPAPRIYRALRQRVRNPHGRSVRGMFGPLSGLRHLLVPGLAVVRETILYFETPIAGLLEEIRRERCTAVLCQEYEYPRFDVCVALGRVLRVPVFATFQGGDYHRSRIEGVVRPITLRACQGLIIASRVEANRVRARYGVSAARIAAIPNPVDSEVWKPSDQRAARAKLGIPAAARVIVWHGRVSIRKKGLDTLLAAWQQLAPRRAGQDVRLVLVGTGSDADDLRRMIANAGTDGIVWIDRFLQERTVLNEYLGAGDVYAFPSRHEGFPVAPVEAMACGLPVVAADARGVADILADGEASGGVIVPHDDAAALAQALGRFVEGEAWCREMGARARHTVVTRFSPDAVGRQLRAVLFAERRRDHQVVR
jgi:glycosyltransferase involved in cell wall biosynthesis